MLGALPLLLIHACADKSGAPPPDDGWAVDCTHHFSCFLG